MANLLSSIGNALKSPFTDRSPHQLAMGLALGILLGFPIPDRHLVLPLLFFLLLRNNVLAVLLGAAIGRGAGILLAQPTFDLGVSLLRDANTFDGLMTWLCNAPFFGLLGLNRYLVFGGFVIAIPASIAVYLAARVLLPKLPLPTRVDTSRPALWNVLRKNVLIGIPVVLLVLTAGSVLAVQFGMSDALARSIQSQMGAETSIASSFANPLQQRIGLTDLVVADTLPGEKEPMIQVREMHFDLDSVALLKGRLNIPEVTLSGLTLRLIRAEDGTLNITRTRAVLGDEQNDQDYWTWVEEKARDVDWLELIGKTVEHVKKSWETPADQTKSSTSSDEGPWFDPYAARDYAANQPLLTISKFALEDCRIEVEDRRDGKVRKLPALHSLNLTIDNLSSDRALLGKNVVSSFHAAIGQDTVGTLDLGSTLGTPSAGDATGPFQLKTEFANVDLMQIAGLFETTMPVDVAQGVFSFVSDVTVEKGGIRPSLGELSLQNLALLYEKGQTLLGLDTEASFWIVKGINAIAKRESIALKTLIEGPVENPRLHWEAELLALGRRGLQYLGPELAAAGAERYLGQINQRLGEEIAALGTFGQALGPDLTQTLEKDILTPLIEGNPEAIGQMIESGKFDALPKTIGGKALNELLPQDLADPVRGLLEGTLIPGSGTKPGEGVDPGKAVEGILKGAGDLLGPKKGDGAKNDPAKSLIEGVGNILGGEKKTDGPKDDPAKKLLEGVGDILGGNKKEETKKDPVKGLLEGAGSILGTDEKTDKKEDQAKQPDPVKGLLEGAGQILEGNKKAEPAKEGGSDPLGGLIRGAGDLFGGKKDDAKEKPKKKKKKKDPKNEGG